MDSTIIASKKSAPTKKTPMKFRPEPEAPPDREQELDNQAALDKNALCVEILMEGFVQSYVDFFYLTHRPDPNPDPHDEGQEKEVDVPVEEMLFIRDNLTRAESARRHGETTQVYDCYNNLARYFQNVDDTKTGIYFYEKCLEISRLTMDKLGEMRANHSLGLAHQSIKNTSNAITYHERHLALAQSIANKEEEDIANTELVKVYRKKAEEMEASKDYRKAITFHEKCLAASQEAKDRASEGLAGYRIGRAYVLLNEADRAISFLDDYHSICKELEDLEGEGAACSALAAAYQSLASIDNAVQYLEQFLEIATKTDNLIAQGEACCNLGVIYNQRGEFAKAVQLFEKNFEIARSTVVSGKGDRTLVDTARVNLGMARGNAQMQMYMNIINHDLTTLLRWKNRRVKFEA
jgi:tetratricopeptide (TPR) repeat protein